MKIEKRDGRIQDFRFEKIEKVIYKVYNSVNKQVPSKLLQQLEEQFNGIIEKSKSKQPGYALPIEDIQDIIRDFLIRKNQIEASQSFILYRDKRNRAREKKSWLNNAIARRIAGADIQNQNANVDEESFGGKQGEITRDVMSDYALKNLVSKTTRDNHNKNIGYIHDRDSYAVGMHNCLSEPFDKMLKNGIKTRQCDVRPANSINTACQLIAVYFQLQSLQQFGGVSATHLDWTLEPYLKKSFAKHYVIEYLKGLDEFYEFDWENMYIEDVEAWVKKQTKKFFEETGLTEDSFYFNNKELDRRLYQRAMYETRRELYQAVEGMYHNLNTLQSRSGNQLPFTSINYGTCTSIEGRMITRALIETSIKGVGKNGETSIFPCGIFQYKKGVNDKPGTPNYDLKQLALKSTAARLYPNFANCDWSNQTKWVKKDREQKIEYINNLGPSLRADLWHKCVENKYIAECLDLIPTNVVGEFNINMEQHPYEIFSTMGCRTANGFNVNYFRYYVRNIVSVLNTGELEQDTFLSAAQKDGRGNICPSTLILPTIAMLAEEQAEKTGEDKVETFIKILTKKIDEISQSLADRFYYISKQSPNCAKFMWENGTMEGYIESEGIISAMINGTLAVGQLGLAETLYILIGKDHTEPEGMSLAHRIEKLFEDKSAEWKAETGLNFGVYYTPAENLCYTAFKKWRDQYGDRENVTWFWKEDENGNLVREDKKFFTNSIHIPVWHKISAFDKISLEAQLTGYSSAGCITYVEVDYHIINNPDALEKIVDYAMEHDIPYLAINTDNDKCQDCGYLGKIYLCCPKCGSTKIKRLGRVTGYLTGHYPDAFNPGKVDEFEERVKHKKTVKF